MATFTSEPQTISARSRYADNVYFQDGSVLTGVLAALLYLMLAASLDAAGYVTSLGLLIPVTLGALALSFLMSFSRFDGFFALSHSMFTGLAWILFLMSGLVSSADILPFTNNGISDGQAKAYFVLLRWLNWVDAAINNVASEDNFIFVFEIAFLTWWLTYLGIWSIFRYGYTWRAIIPAGVVLLINTYYAPDSIVGFLVVFSLVAMLLLVRTNLAEQQLRWREQRVYFNQDIALDFLRNGLLYAVIVLALAWIAPGLGRSLQVRTVLGPLNDRWQQTTDRWNRLYQGINRQTRPVSAAFGRTLSLGGARDVGDNFVFRVDTPSVRYWRAVVYDTYTGRQWLNTAEEEQEFEAGEAVPVAAWSSREVLTQTITLMAPTGSMLFGAPDILHASVPMAALVRPVPAPLLNAEDNDGQAVEVSRANARTSMESGDSYTIVSIATDVVERGLESAGTDYPPGITEPYLQLPDNFSVRVGEEALSQTAGYATAYAKAKAIETFLRGYLYNDEIEAPPADRDPVEYFLYDIEEGYCDYYATSMVVMLRSIGIPSRVVSGYAEGTYDEESNQFFVTERDAHTWVEVYFPGYGWIEFEPTAGESQLNRPTGDELLPSDFPEAALGSAAPQGPTEEELLSGQDSAGQGRLDEELGLDEGGSGLSQTTLWLWVVLTPLVLLAGLWFIWRSRYVGPSHFDPDLPPIFYDRLQRWAARLGLQPPESHTPYEQARGLGRAMPEGRSSIETITNAYVLYRFRPYNRVAEPMPDEDKSGPSLFLSWQELRPILWKAWFNKVFGIRKTTEGDPYTLIAK